MFEALISHDDFWHPAAAPLQPFTRDVPPRRQGVGGGTAASKERGVPQAEFGLPDKRSVDTVASRQR